MAKRLSSLFSSKLDTKPRSSTPDSLSSRYDEQAGNQSRSSSRSDYRLPPLFTSTHPLSDLETIFSPLEPPPTLGQSGGIPSSISNDRRSSISASRAVSPSSLEGRRSRAQTPSMLAPPSRGSTPDSRPGTPGSGGKLSKRRSWVPGRSEKSDRQAFEDTGHGRSGESKAWIAGLREHVAYDIQPLLNGYKVSDIWNEEGDVLIYLFPQDSGKGPSFKVDSSLFADSKTFSHLMHQSRNNPVTQSPADLSTFNPSLADLSLHDGRSPNGSRRSSHAAVRMSINFSTPNLNSVSQDSHIHRVYLPLEFDANMSGHYAQPQGDDLELIVLYRNFFAFLVGGALVSTPRQVSLYAIFMGISTILKRLTYSSPDGSTYGKIPSESFGRYCDELRLADVRASREKNIEALVLGEQMRYWPLYNEGFVHAVGRLVDMKSIRSPKYEKISPVTLNRLERASLDLKNRLLVVRTKLEDFDFPSMFAGIANSQVATEGRLVRFPAWKAAFLDFRRFTVSQYKRKYGAWPPRASSKKNKFEESGLNRSLLLEVYKDFTDLYDMLVNRHSPTPRTVDMTAMLDEEPNSIAESAYHSLRIIESEYDRASPPVMPAIPFDIPLLPAFEHSFNPEHAIVSSDAGFSTTLSTRKLPENEVNEVLLGSYNRESMNASPWIQEYIQYERRSGAGKTMNEIIDLRCGQWLFIYAVLQALPMTVVDARDVKFTQDVEYFLCIPPRGGRPWMREDTSTSRAWYNVANGGGYVSLPADMIDHSVEGIYRRSHCWTTSTQWFQALSPDEAHHHPPGAAPIPTTFESLQPPLRLFRQTPHLSPGQSPRPSPHSSPLLRPISPAASSIRSATNSETSRIPRSARSSIQLGLAQTAPPEAVTKRPVSTYNPNLTFDHILQGMESGDNRKNKKKK